MSQEREVSFVDSVTSSLYTFSSGGGDSMKYGSLGLLALALVVLLAPAPGAAHHEILAKFDDSKPLTLRGTVTLVEWRNPHVHVFMNVQDGRGIVNWAIELESPIDLDRSGWTAESVRAGDAITVQGIAARDG